MSFITGTFSGMFLWMHLFIATVKKKSHLSVCVCACVLIAQPCNWGKDKHYNLTHQTLQLPFQSLQRKHFFFFFNESRVFLAFKGDLCMCMHAYIDVCVLAWFLSN